MGAVREPPALCEVDAQARFADWVAPHWRAMARMSWRLNTPGDWEDVLQETLAVAWRKRHLFDSNRGSARNWLLALTADQSRKARRWRRAHGLAADQRPVHDSTNEIAAAVDIERLVSKLPPRQRLAVDLHYFLDLPVEDVAHIMHCSPGTVKSTLSDARRRLRTELGDDR